MGAGYVDDVTLGCTSTIECDNESILDSIPAEETEVIRDVEDMGQKWEKMLFANGGLLELRKCCWILISWRWLKGVAILKHDWTEK